MEKGRIVGEIDAHMGKLGAKGLCLLYKSLTHQGETGRGMLPKVQEFSVFILLGCKL